MSTSPFKPKSLAYYAELTAGGEYRIKLTRDEACIALKVYDYGADNLDEQEKHVLHTLMGKLKDQIWP